MKDLSAEGLSNKKSLTISRRSATKLMGTGALSVLAAALTGCFFIGREALVEGLLKEKYGRSFVVTGKPYGFDWKSEPTAYCRERADADGPAFVAGFDPAKRVLLGDAFVSRKIGRQVEEVITECFLKQGIAVAPNGAVGNAGDDPDITLEEYIAGQTKLNNYSFVFVISDALVSPRTNQKFASALFEIEDITKMNNRMQVYIVKEQDFKEYSRCMRAAPFFGGFKEPAGKVIDGFHIGVKDSKIDILEDDNWKQYAY